MSSVRRGFFNLSYLGVPPWDTGRPQPGVIRLEEQGGISGSVLDAGCGTGENALYLASRGHEAWGIDSSANAIRKARAKARERGVQVRFLKADALALGALGRVFDTVVDCGLFHTFSDPERERYVESLSSVLPAGGKLVILCFSDRDTGSIGPRRISQAEIRSSFDAVWTVQDIRPARFETNVSSAGIEAWLCLISRT